MTTQRELRNRMREMKEEDFSKLTFDQLRALFDELIRLSQEIEAEEFDTYKCDFMARTDSPCHSRFKHPDPVNDNKPKKLCYCVDCGTWYPCDEQHLCPFPTSI